MTTTPTVWKPQHQLNPTETVDLNQQALAIVDIGLGRYITVYHEFGDYRGQIFDAEGNRVGDTFLVNVASTLDSSGLSGPALATRPGGGFVAAYIAGGLSNGVFFDVYDADGDRISGGTIQSIDTHDLTGPSIAMRTDGSFLVTFVRKNDGDGTFDVVGRRVSSNGTVDSSEITIFDSGDTDQTFAEAATLSNGNYVVAYQNFAGAGDHDIEFKIFGQTGDPPAGFFQAAITFDDETDPQVAALTGGAFVIVWRDGNDGSGSGIMAAVFDNATGAMVNGPFLVNTGTSGNQTSPDVAALKDGGFVVTWDDDGTGTVRGQRFNAAGTKVGSEFIAGDATTEGFPVAATLGDGRFVVGFDAGKGPIATLKFDLDGTIFDPREKTINGTSGTDVLTSRIDGATVNGLGGGDTLLGQGSADRLDGGTGVDTMKGRGGDDTYIVDEQGDFPVESFNQGNDLVLSSVSYSLVDNIERLTLTGTAVSGGGNGSANVITGHNGGNRLDGFNGNDTLLGIGGDDFLFGGNNNDTLEGNNGNDALDGGAGVDTMRGGAQNDTYVVDNTGDKAIESAGQGTDLVRASVSFTLGANVENLTLLGTAANGTGNGLANVITGNGAANRINGGIGIDTLTGGAGRDAFVFNAAVNSKAIAAANADIISDFNPKDDTIELLASMFPKLKVGVLKNKAFESGKKKPAKDKHLVYYDEKKGDLWYDANGKKQGGKGDVLIAKLDPGLDLTAGDILVA